MRIRIGAYVFPSRRAARELCASYLNMVGLRERVIAEAEPFLAALFGLHPDFLAKVAGRTLDHFEVHPFEHGSRCFFAVFTDGSWIDFSVDKCLKAAPRSSDE